jgi:hypothetical protein
MLIPSVLESSTILKPALQSGTFCLSDTSHSIIFSLFSARGDYFIKIGGKNIVREFHFLKAAHESLNELVPEALELVCDVKIPNAEYVNIAVYKYLDMTCMGSNLDSHMLKNVAEALCNIEKYINESCVLSKKNAQHGDFYVNNIGIHGNSLIVFDWEDVGSVADIGFDFSIFVSSWLDFDADRILREYVRGGSNSISAMIDCYVTLGDHDPEAIISSLPRHLRTFAKLKQSKGYGTDICERVHDCYTRLESEIFSG